MGAQSEANHLAMEPPCLVEVGCYFHFLWKAAVAICWGGQEESRHGFHLSALLQPESPASHLAMRSQSSPRNPKLLEAPPPHSLLLCSRNRPPLPTTTRKTRHPLHRREPRRRAIRGRLRTTEVWSRNARGSSKAAPSGTRPPMRISHRCQRGTSSPPRETALLLPNNCPTHQARAATLRQPSGLSARRLAQRRTLRGAEGNEPARPRGEQLEALHRRGRGLVKQGAAMDRPTRRKTEANPVPSPPQPWATVLRCASRRRDSRRP